MLWIPITAAGIINGVGHYWGYRNFACEDASTNILPWGILIGGEELHNNHHAYGSSAKLSNRWYEFDIGWLYIRILEILGLASVKKVAPKVRWGEIKHFCDTDLLHAIITHRYDVLTRYRRGMKQAYAQELEKLRGNFPDMAKVWRWLNLDQERCSRPKGRNCSRSWPRATGSRPSTRCARISPPCGAAPPPAANNWCASSRTGARGPRPAASRPCPSSPGVYAVTPDPSPGSGSGLDGFQLQVEDAQLPVDVPDRGMLIGHPGHQPDPLRGQSFPVFQDVLARAQGRLDLGAAFQQFDAALDIIQPLLDPGRVGSRRRRGLRARGQQRQRAQQDARLAGNTVNHGSLLPFAIIRGLIRHGIIVNPFPRIKNPAGAGFFIRGRTAYFTAYFSLVSL
jgi:hypothetical protein